MLHRTVAWGLVNFFGKDIIFVENNIREKSIEKGEWFYFEMIGFNKNLCMLRRLVAYGETIYG